MSLKRKFVSIEAKGNKKTTKEIQFDINLSIAMTTMAFQETD